MVSIGHILVLNCTDCSNASAYLFYLETFFQIWKFWKSRISGKSGNFISRFCSGFFQISQAPEAPGEQFGKRGYGRKRFGVFRSGELCFQCKQNKHSLSNCDQSLIHFCRFWRNSKSGKNTGENFQKNFQIFQIWKFWNARKKVWVVHGHYQISSVLE